jgi:hypothetical protein
MDVQVGQVWKEIDNRPGFALHKTVVGFAGDGRVVLRSGTGRKTRAQRERFNGKTGGYRLIRAKESAS